MDPLRMKEEKFYSVTDMLLDMVCNPTYEWQTEPTGDGWYWVEGEPNPCKVWMSDGQEKTWMIELTVKMVWFEDELSGRRVAPVTWRPQS